MRKIECFLFDVDGTLIDTSELITFALIKTIIEESNKKAKKVEIKKHVKESPKTILKKYGISNMKSYWKNYDQNINLASLFFDETRDSLNLIKQNNAKLGIVSSIPERRIKILLKHFLLADLFDTVVGWQRNIPNKPNPAPINIALNQLGADHKKTIYFGDTEADIQASKRAGVLSIFAGWSDSIIRDSIEPDIIIYHINELTNL